MRFCINPKPSTESALVISEVENFSLGVWGILSAISLPYNSDEVDHQILEYQ
jgi:hypothetical protein